MNVKFQVDCLYAKCNWPFFKKVRFFFFFCLLWTYPRNWLIEGAISKPYVQMFSKHNLQLFIPSQTPLTPYPWTYSLHFVFPGSYCPISVFISYRVNVKLQFYLPLLNLGKSFAYLRNCYKLFLLWLGL